MWRYVVIYVFKHFLPSRFKFLLSSGKCFHDLLKEFKLRNLTIKKAQEKLIKSKKEAYLFPRGIFPSFFLLIIPKPFTS